MTYLFLFFGNQVNQPFNCDKADPSSHVIATIRQFAWLHRFLILLNSPSINQEQLI